MKHKLFKYQNEEGGRKITSYCFIDLTTQNLKPHQTGFQESINELENVHGLHDVSKLESVSSM